MENFQTKKISSISVPKSPIKSYGSLIYQILKHIKSQTKLNPLPHIFFLKTHKTASSTVQNLLLRYADYNNLKIAEPNTEATPMWKRFIFDYSMTNDENSYITPSGIKPLKDYNLVCHHMRLSEDIFRFLYRNVKNKTSIFKFTIMRSPVSLFESTFGWAKPWYKAFTKANDPNTYIRSPEKFYDSETKKQFGHNHMMYDLGYSADETNDTKIDGIIKRVDRIFDLVLIQDYFQESLILLKEKLNLEFLDIVSFKTHARKSKFKIRSANEGKIKAWNKADTKLFDYFNNTFWQEVLKYGLNRMKHQVQVLQNYTNDITDLCLVSEDDDKKMKNNQRANELVIFKVRKDLDHGVKKFCEKIVMKESLYSFNLFRKQERSIGTNKKKVKGKG